MSEVYERFKMIPLEDGTTTRFPDWLGGNTERSPKSEIVHQFYAKDDHLVIVKAYHKKQIEHHEYEYSRETYAYYPRQWWFNCYVYMPSGVVLNDPRFYEGFSICVDKGAVYGIDMNHLEDGHESMADHLHEAISRLFQLYGEVREANALIKQEA